MYPSYFYVAENVDIWRVNSQNKTLNFRADVSF